jgi:uncharacterized protein YyaL (SSP411 family)
VAALVLLRLATLTGRENYRNLGTAVLREVADQTRRYPSGFGYALSAMDFLLSTPKEVAIVGKDQTDIQPMLAETWRRYLPNKVVAAGTEASEFTPLLENRPLVNGLATAYVCEHFTCKQPVTDVAELAAQLQTG